MKLWEGMRRILKGSAQDRHIQGLLPIESIGSSNWALMEDVFDLAQIALWEWDIARDRICGTRQLYDIFGTQPGDYGDSLYASLEALVHPEHRSYVQSVLKDALRSGGVDRFKFRIVRKDGQERWLMVKARIQPDGKSAAGLIIDYSQNQHAELSLYKDLEFIQSMVDAIPNPIFYKDDAGVYQYCNLAFAQLLGTHRENILGKTVYDVASQGLAHLYHQMDLDLMRNGGTQEYESQVQTITGDDRTYRFHKAPCKDMRGALTGLVGAMTDITDYTAGINRARRLTQLKEAMLEVSHSIIGMHDTKNLLELLLDKAIGAIPSSHAGSVLMVDEAGYLRMLVSRGYSTEGVDAFKLKVEETFTYRISGGCFEEPFVVNHIPQLVADGCLKPLTTLDGRMIASNLSTPIKVEGDPVALVIVDSFDDEVFTAEDMELMGYLKVQAELALTNLKLYQETLRLSRFDHLTGVYNRGHFDTLLKAFLERPVELPHRFTLVIMDLDGLKTVNDRLGHREGDLRLQAFAQRFRGIMREEDILGRYGGDEFIALFFEKDQQLVCSLVDTITAELGQNPAAYCSFSYGTAHYPEDGKTHEDLVRIADRKLYTHKRDKYFGRRREDYGNQNQ